jgi:hypothetical protein
VELDGTITGVASVPSDASTGSNEAVGQREGDPSLKRSGWTSPTPIPSPETLVVWCGLKEVSGAAVRLPLGPGDLDGDLWTRGELVVARKPQ